MIVLALSGRMIIFSPENMMLFLRQKMKGFSQKEIHGNMMSPANSAIFPERWSFQNSCTEI